MQFLSKAANLGRKKGQLSANQKAVPYVFYGYIELLNRIIFYNFL